MCGVAEAEACARGRSPGIGHPSPAGYATQLHGALCHMLQFSRRCLRLGAAPLDTSPKDFSLYTTDNFEIFTESSHHVACGSIQFHRYRRCTHKHSHVCAFHGGGSGASKGRSPRAGHLQEARPSARALCDNILVLVEPVASALLLCLGFTPSPVRHPRTRARRGQAFVLSTHTPPQPGHRRSTRSVGWPV
jgi:hypothetical protein